MRRLFPAAALLLTCGIAHADDTDITPKRLHQAMAYGEVTHLNDIETAFDKDLLVRLYEVPRFDGNCFKETHGVCQNTYYVSVSTFDEYPQANVFKLDNRGDVTDVKWIETDQYEHAKIKLRMTRYTKAARQNNTALADTNKTVTLELTPQKVTEAHEDDPRRTPN